MATDASPLLLGSRTWPAWCNSRECWKFTGGAASILITGVYLIGDFASWAKQCGFVPGLGSWVTFARGCGDPNPSGSPSPSPSASPSTPPEPPNHCDTLGVLPGPVVYTTVGSAVTNPHAALTYDNTSATISMRYAGQFGPGESGFASFQGTPAQCSIYLQKVTMTLTQPGRSATFFTQVSTNGGRCEITGAFAIVETGDTLSSSSKAGMVPGPAIMALIQHATSRIIASVAETTAPGSGPMAQTAASMAIGMTSAAVTGDLVPLVQAALTLLATQATDRPGRLTTACASSALQLVAGNVPGAMITIAATGAHEATSSQTARDAINAVSVSALLYCAAGTSLPAAAMVAIVHFGISQASKVTAAEPTTKAPPAPSTSKQETWLQWGQRMLGCNSRNPTPSPA